MVDPALLAVTAIAAIASLFMAWSIGAGSSGSTPFAPAVGANAVSVMRAGFLVGIFCFAGAVLQGQNVSETMGRGLIGGVTLSPSAAAIALLTAAGLVMIGVFTGYPIATAFTSTGAVIGAGLALGGTPVWGQYQQIAALWTLTPFVGGGVAYVTAVTIRREDVPDRLSVPVLAGVVGALLANIEFALLGSDGEDASVAQSASAWADLGLGVDPVGPAATLLFAGIAASIVRRDMRGDVERGERHFLLALGALVAFSAGGSQVGLAIGPLLPVLDPYSIPLFAVLLAGGIGLLVGAWTGAPRMIKAIAQDYSSLGPRRSIAALIPSFAIAQTAILFGIPVSFNQIIVSAVVGAGAAASAGGAGVSRSKIFYTVVAWTGSLALALALGYGLVTGVSLAF